MPGVAILRALLPWALALMAAHAGCTADDSVLQALACDTDADCAPAHHCGPRGFCIRDDTDAACGGACTELEQCDGASLTCLCTADGTPTSCADDEQCCASGCQDTAADPNHCGACDNRCGEGEACVDGTCACGDAGTPCGDGLICCAGTCVDPRFDSACCGDARTDCQGAPCNNGACICPTGTASCDAASTSCETNLLTDDLNCGSCGASCGALSCVGGSCLCSGDECADGELCCGGDCLDPASLQTNPRHCGACGNACPPNHDCVGGQCSCGNEGPCASGDLCCGPPGSRQCVGAGDPLCVCGDTPDCAQTCCDDTFCADLDVDTAHCGACGNACGAGQRCDAGTCVCDDDALTVCGSSCIDLTTDEANCGACGRACDDNQTCCGGTCVKTSAGNADHCGACFASCTGSGGCSGGLCMCTLFASVDLASDINNCGGCGVRCNRTRLTGVVCTEAVCDYTGASCDAGYGDCVDGMAVDGCETLLATDSAHCGACGNACGVDERCFDGTCLDVGEIVEVSAGEAFSCARRSNGVVECWGRNNDNQLGDGTGGARDVPGQVPGVRAVALASGTRHSCVASPDGRLWCWGRDNDGSLGPNATSSVSPPVEVPVDGEAVAVAAGDRHSCAIVDRGAVGGAAGEVWCWGNNSDGALGDGTTVSSATPVRATGVTDAIAIAAGFDTTCAATSSGALWCWGSNDSDIVGAAVGCSDTRVPCQIAAVTAARDVALTQRAAFALTTQGEVYGWGDDIDSLLMNSPATTPTVLATGFAAVATGGTTGCAITTAGGAQCWGLHKEGQAGVGDTGQERLDAPTDVVGLQTGVVDLAVGRNHGCAALGARGAACWGRNDDGQLGAATNDRVYEPVPVQALP